MTAVEQEAIVRSQRGDSQSFGVLYDAYVRKIYDFVYFRTFHKETAEDLTSHIFTKALLKIDSFKLGSNFSSWLYTIARNTIIDHYRTHKSTVALMEDFELRNRVNLEQDLDVKLELKKVKDYINNLESEQRDIMIMRIWDNLPYKEIAEILDKSEASCKVAFSRMMKEMKEHLKITV